MAEAPGILEVQPPPRVRLLWKKEPPVPQNPQEKPSEPKTQAKEGKITEEHLTRSLDDEFNNTNVTILEPLKQVVVVEGGKSKYDLEDALRKEFEYYSRTRKLEVGTERTKILQEIVDRMTEGKIKTNVVIMNKGVEEAAFTYPDGTIFVSQSLINSLTSMDEIAGVLAHEVGHLIFKTSDKRRQAPNKLCDFGIGWVHEAASDLNAPDLLVKAGFNSSGFANAIRIISGGERGRLHQTGLSRSAQNIGLHAGIDFETSHIKFSEIDPILKTADVDPTNIEIFNEALKKLAVVHMEKIAYSLHPRDFLKAYQAITNQEYEYGYGENAKNKIEKQVQMLEAFHNVFRKRLEGKGYSKNEIDLFILIEQGKNPKSFRFIESPERLLQITENLREFIENHKAQDMVKFLLEDDNPEYLSGEKTVLTVLLENLANNMYEFVPGKENNQNYGIPVTEDALLAVLQRINEFSDFAIDRGGEKARPFTHVLGRWLSIKFYPPYNETPADRDIRLGKAKEFLLKAKSMNIQADSKYVEFSFEKFKPLFYEVFGKEKEEEALSLNELIDRFLEGYMKSPDYTDSSSRREGKREYFSDFVLMFRTYRDSEKFTDKQVLSYLEYFDKQLDNLQMKSSYSAWNFLENRGFKEADVGDLEINDRILKFNFKLNLAMFLFSKDSDEFYSYVSKLIDDIGIDTQSLSKTQLINLSTPLLGKTMLLPSTPRGKDEINLIEPYVYSGQITIANYSSFAKIPFIERIIDQNEDLPFTTLKELNGYISEMKKSCFVSSFITDLFLDSPGPLIIGRNVRKSFDQILQKGIKEEEYSDLYEFLSTCFPHPDPQIDEFQREINKRFFASDAKVQDKIHHFIRFADQLGPEGALLTADQIKKMEDYLYFRQRLGEKLQGYLSGESKRTAELATLDNLSAELVKNFKMLLDTTKTDLPSKSDINTRLAQEWAKTFDHDYLGAVVYDPESKKIILSDKARTGFKTVADSIDILRNLTPAQRFLLSQKALLDKEGALTTDENRRLLGETIVGALKPRTTFISSALRLAVEGSPPDFISFPAAQMLSGILFEGLDVKSVDPAKVKSEKVPHDELVRIMNSNTREASLFGARYRGNFDTIFGQTAQESDNQYHRGVEVLKGALLSSNGKESKPKLEVAPSTEAIIKGVEMTGALGVRSLQLARQLHRFPQNVDKRLSQAFDARPGLSKLLFWENLYRMSLNGNGNRNGNGIAEFTDRLVTLDNYLGGGSLYTTFAATIRNPETDTFSEVAVKMLNPNARLFIEKPYQIVGDVLGKIENEGSAEDKQYAKMSQIFLDLSNRWCLNDIDDPTFEVDDDIFRQTIDSFNKSEGSEIFYAPERVFNSPKLKSEEKAPGKTLNQVLNDSSVSNAQKQSLVQIINKFFSYQTKTPVKTTDGKKYFLVHSDPHIGNFMVDLTEDQPRIGVIDRNMYLRLAKEDVALFQPLLEGKGYGSMLEPMIERLLDRNKIVGKADRRAIKNRILFGVRGEFVVQAWESLKRLKLKPDNFAILRRFMGEAANAGLDIPLSYQLMIRNIEAFRELSKRYAA